MVGGRQVAAPTFGLEIRNLAGFQLQLELIGDEGDELAVGGLALDVCVGNDSTNKFNPHRIGKPPERWGLLFN